MSDVRPPPRPFVVLGPHPGLRLFWALENKREPGLTPRRKWVLRAVRRSAGIEPVNCGFGPADRPYWTPADEAEWDLLVTELFRAVWLHRDRCLDCNHASLTWCAPLEDAFWAVWEWREGRILRSKAVWLAMLQAELEQRVLGEADDVAA
jgi:hypothetical protein